VGDDDNSPFNQQIIQAIRELVVNGTPVYFMHGNRDFLIGNKFAQASAVTLLKDPTVIQLYGKQILLSHGDILCTLDRKHQIYRQKVHRPWLQKLFLSLPLILRRKIAQKIRQKSQRHNQIAPTHIMDVSPDEVQRIMSLHQVSLLIHGHTHRPAIHKNKTGTRIVLSAWHDKGSALIYHDDGQYQLINF
jgi:UDP-2,3-diacylglucosamine hydrolase